MKSIKLDEYKLLDTRNGMKLENWNGIILLRPDPEIIWNKENNIDYININAKYVRSKTGGGEWKILKSVPSSFVIHYDEYTFNLKLMGFKHTGLFPEQAYNWKLLKEKLNGKKNVKVLNLFAYTGAHSVVALKAGASVVHVDSSRGMVDWAKENVNINNLSDRPIRYIVDDVVKFVKREIRRGNKYDIIIMDPPSFGRGANKEVWKVENDLFNLVNLCTEILSDNPILFLINSYTTGLSMTVLENILKLTINKKYKGYISSDELGIIEENSDVVLPCGVYARWEKEKYE